MTPNILILCLFLLLISITPNAYSEGLTLKYSKQGNLKAIYFKFDQEETMSCSKPISQIYILKKILTKNNYVEMTLYSENIHLKDMMIDFEGNSKSDRIKINSFFKKGNKYHVIHRNCGNGGVPALESIKLIN